jgi:hypothetical protein
MDDGLVKLSAARPETQKVEAAAPISSEFESSIEAFEMIGKLGMWIDHCGACD